MSSTFAGGAGAGQGVVDRSAAEPALRLLDERHARGEIDREEFLQKKADLQSYKGGCVDSGVGVL